MLLEHLPGAIAVYKIGSAAFGFIDHPNDTDYLVVYKTNDSIDDNINSIEALQEQGDVQFWPIALEDLTSGRYLNLHKLKYSTGPAIRRGYLFFANYLAPLNTLFIHWAKFIEGEDIGLNKLTKLTPQYLRFLIIGLQWVRQKIINYDRRVDGEDIPFTIETADLVTKSWYYFFIAYYVIQNRSFELTESQIKIINDTHDRKLSLAECKALSFEIENLI